MLLGRSAIFRPRAICLALCLVCLTAILVSIMNAPGAVSAAHPVVEQVHQLDDPVRILCVTVSANEPSKLNATWSRRCHVHLHVRYADAATRPIVNVPVLDQSNDTDNLLPYVWTNYRDRVDWLVKADDETYLLMDNLRQMASTLHPSDLVWFGWNLKQTNGKVNSGYLLSRETLGRLAEGTRIETECRDVTEFKLKECLTKLRTNPIDSGDQRSVPFNWHLFNSTENVGTCCSESLIAFCGVDPHQMNLIEFIGRRHHHPAGSSKERTMPRAEKDCDKSRERPLVRSGVPESTGNRIFFLETSGRPTMKLRAACAVESAARHNPQRLVQVLIFNATPEVDSPSMRVWANYANIQVYGLTFEQFFNQTPLEPWFRQGLWRQSPYSVSHMSDFVRMLELWRGGGIYMDTDFVVLKPLHGLGNFSCNESPDATSSGVVGLDVGHPLLDLLVHDLPRSYQPLNWGNSGPAALQRALKIYCNETVVQQMTRDKCGGYRLLPTSYFYPIHYTEWKRYFNESEELDNYGDSYALHVWNNLSANETVRVGSRQLYALAAAKHCPHVFATAATAF